MLILFNSQLTFFSDDALYASLARFFVNGELSKAFHPTWPPLYPAISAFIYVFVQRWEPALRITSTLSSTALMLPLFYLVKKEFGSLQAVVYCLTISFLTPIFLYSLLPQSDLLATFLVVTSIALAFTAIKKQKPDFLLASSFTTGLAFLTRSEGLLFFYLTGIYFLIYTIIKRKTSSFRVLFFYVLIFFITTSPYLLIMRQKFGSWTLTHKASAQIKQEHAFALRANGTTWSQEVVSVETPNYASEFFKGGSDYVLEHSDWFILWFTQKIGWWKAILLKNFPPWFLVLASIGIIRSLRKDFWASSYLVFISSLAIPATIFATPIADTRYLLWAIPILFFFFYKGVEINKAKLLTLFVVSVTPFYLPSFSLQDIKNPIAYAKNFNNNYYMEEIIAAANFINQTKTNSKPKIIGRHEGLEFYTNGLTIYLPQQISIKELIAYGQKMDADYLAAWKRELLGEEEFKPLVNPAVKFPGLTKKFSYPQNSPEIIIYALDKIPQP